MQRYKYNAVFKKVSQVIADHKGISPDSLDDKTSMELDLNIDQVDMLVIVGELEKEFDIKIPDKYIWKYKRMDLIVKDIIMRGKRKSRDARDQE